MVGVILSSFVTNYCSNHTSDSFRIKGLVFRSVERIDTLAPATH